MLQYLVVLPYIIPDFPDGASVIDVLEECLSLAHAQRGCHSALIPNDLTCLNLLQTLDISLTEFLEFRCDDHHTIALTGVLAIITLVIVFSGVKSS